MALAGALTTPLIAFEVFGQKSLNGLLYGTPIVNGFKYGLYSPVLMAGNSLELGHWMALAATPAFALWCTRSGPTMAGRPFGFWAARRPSAEPCCATRRPRRGC